MDQIPGMVLINRIVPGYAHRCVGLDNVSGAMMATKMLIQQRPSADRLSGLQPPD